MKIRTYKEMIKFPTYEQRFEYLRLDGSVGVATFGFDRYLNQRFYKSREWLDARRDVIARDLGCDLGISDRIIFDSILIHHMNPITPEDIEDRNEDILNPDYLVCVSHATHNAIHFSDRSKLVNLPVERKPGDTKLW